MTGLVVGKHLGHKSACLVLGHPTQGACPTPVRAGTESSLASPAWLVTAPPCPSLSGCVFCKTTFLLGLTRDPPHPPMGGSCHSLPWPRRLTPSPCVFSFRKPRQRPDCSSALPREPSQGLRGARARTCLPHIPWLVYLFCWPGPREPLTAGPGLGVAVVIGLHRQVTEPPTRNSRGKACFWLGPYCFLFFWPPSFSLGILRRRGD